MKWRLMGLSLLSAVLLPLALPNQLFEYGNIPLGFICLAPAFISISLSPSFKFASLLGVIYGAVSTAIADYWLMFFQGFSVWTYGGVIFGYLGVCALLFPVLRGFVIPRPRQRPFVLAAGWAVWEYLKSIGFLGFPWGLVAYPGGDILPLAQFIDITGIWGLSFLMAMANAIVAEGALFALHAAPPWRAAPWAPAGVRTPRPDTASLFLRQAAFLGILLTVVLFYGGYRLSTQIPKTGTVRLLLVQQNIDPWVGADIASRSTAINEELTLKGLQDAGKGHVDMAVWSEGSVPDVFVLPDLRLTPSKNSLTGYAVKSGTYTLFGGVTVVSMSRQKFMNSVSLLTPQGAIADTYGKMHPVPFAEYIPFSANPAVDAFFRNVIGIWNVWTPGRRYTIFKIPLSSGGTLSFASPICFEDAFSDLCRRFILKGADMWINLTNDYWSKTVSSEVQHFQAARFRAIENRRVLVRSTNGGVTAVIGPHGRVLASLPLFERKTLLVDVPVYKERSLTFYTRFGDWFPRVLGAFLFVYLFVNVLQEWDARRRRLHTARVKARTTDK